MDEVNNRNSKENLRYLENLNNLNSREIRTEVQNFKEELYIFIRDQNEAVLNRIKQGTEQKKSVEDIIKETQEALTSNSDDLVQKIFTINPVRIQKMNLIPEIKSETIEKMLDLSPENISAINILRQIDPRALDAMNKMEIVNPAVLDAMNKMRKLSPSTLDAMYKMGS